MTSPTLMFGDIELRDATINLRLYPADRSGDACGQINLHAGLGLTFSLSGVTPEELRSLAAAFGEASAQLSELAGLSPEAKA